MSNRSTLSASRTVHPLPLGVWLLREPVGCVHREDLALMTPEVRRRMREAFAGGRRVVVGRAHGGQVVAQSAPAKPAAGLVIVEVAGPIEGGALERLGAQLAAGGYLVTISRSLLDMSGGLLDLPSLTVATARRAGLRYLQHLVAIPGLPPQPACSCMPHVDLLVFVPKPRRSGSTP